MAFYSILKDAFIFIGYNMYYINFCLSFLILADLSLFSTKTLVETSGDHQVEVRTQVCILFYGC